MRALRPVAAAVAAVLTLLGAGDIGRAALLDDQPIQRRATPSTAEPGFSFGVVPQARPGHEELRMMETGGIDSVRLVFSWSRVERNQGLYDWSELDALVADAARGGVTPLAVLYGSPRWAAVARASRCEPWACASLGPASAAAGERFARFAGLAARRYGVGGDFWWFRPDLPEVPVRVWEVWNEPNSSSFFGPVPDATAYGELLTMSAAHIHAADPGAQVLVGGLATRRFAPSGTLGPAGYLRDLLADPETAQAFDGVGTHPYAGATAGVLRQVRALRRVLDDADLHGAGLWVTELGWASSGDRRHPLVTRERRQARLLRRAFRQLRGRAGRWNLGGAYWYSWRDTPREHAVCGWCAGTGLLAADARPKPAWRRITALARR